MSVSLLTAEPGPIRMSLSSRFENIELAHVSNHHRCSWMIKCVRQTGLWVKFLCQNDTDARSLQAFNKPPGSRKKINGNDVFIVNDHYVSSAPTAARSTA